MAGEARSIAVGAIILAAVLGGRGPWVRAQEVVQPLQLPAGGLPNASCPKPVRLPNVPVREPRPAEGAALDQKWRTDVDPATPPTAAFVESLRGNDAVIQVVLGQGRLVTLKADVANEQGIGVIAVADPTVVEFDVMPNPRVLRLLSRRAGVTDLSVTTADGQVYNFEIHVVYDLQLLTAQLQQLFPDAQLRLTQIREHLAVEGQARSIRQVEQILKTLEAYLDSVQVASSTKSTEAGVAGQPRDASRGRPGTPQAVPEGQTPGEPAAPGAGAPSAADAQGPGQAVPEPGGKPDVEGKAAAAQIINLLRVPGVHQVMLQVQIAELNRTALREVGADWIWGFGAGNVLQTFIGARGLATVTGLFPTADLEVALRVLRTNQLLSVLAEPNLVALSGQKADFLAGGEFPVPVPQASGGGTTITVEFKKFGVQLEFVPYVLEDETIRLTVNSEESSPDSTNAVEIEGFFVPGINTRRASTTVEMRQGQSLAVAGLLRVSIEANTSRIPGLGDLPYIGPLFSNTTHQRIEKELVILVTPVLVAPMNPDDVPCLPTDGVTDPNDLEFYLLNRIEGRTGREFSSARNWDDPWHLRELMHLEQRCISGPVGLSPME